MPRVVGPRVCEVLLSNHGYSRFVERTGQKIKLSRVVRKVLGKRNEALRCGLCLDKHGDGWIDIYPSVWACVRLESRGWVVLTFIDWDKDKSLAG